MSQSQSSCLELSQTYIFMLGLTEYNIKPDHNCANKQNCKTKQNEQTNKSTNITKTSVGEISKNKANCNREPYGTNPGVTATSYSQ